MSQFDMHIEWLDPPGPEEAFGPERDTWGKVSIVVAGECLTAHVLTDVPRTEQEEQDAVIGGLSGLADWLVENWIAIFWDIRTPFPKATDRHVPTFSDVRAGKVQADVEPDVLAAWQHRHTFGHASSDIALPSIVFLPEDKYVGIAVGPLSDDLNPTVRFKESRSLEPVWIAKDALCETLTVFVLKTLRRASCAASEQAWADWLAKRFREVLDEAIEPAVRRRWMFGEVVASRWEALASALGPNVSAFSGVLIDAERITRNADLETLTDTVRRTAEKSSGKQPLWRTLKSQPGDHLLPAYRRGYRLAEQARAVLGEPNAPLADLHEVLGHFGVDLDAFAGPPVFRSASIAGVSGRASVLYTKAYPRFAGVAPTRFAIAAGLGRLLANGHVVDGNAFGAAHGHQSRWRETQQANAFAAAFLLPDGALLESTDVESLSEKYGISRLATERHRENRLRELRDLREQ